MKIAIVGAGNVGRALGGAFRGVGHTVTYGVLEPKNATDERLPGDAVKGTDVIVLSTPWPATKGAIASLGSLAGRVVVDCTNPIRADFADLEQGAKSGGEQVQEWAAGAKVVKCFNQTGFENMANARFGAQRPVMFAAGNDEAATKLVADLASQIGFEGLPLGGLHLARHLESLAWVWIHGALKAKIMSRDVAFGILRR